MQPNTRTLTLMKPFNSSGAWLAVSRTVVLRANLTLLDHLPQRAPHPQLSHCRLPPLHPRQLGHTRHRRLLLTMSTPFSIICLIVRIRLRSIHENALTHDSVSQVQVLCRHYQSCQTQLSLTLISQTLCKLQWRALAYSSTSY